jgi:hypothetical protein
MGEDGVMLYVEKVMVANSPPWVARMDGEGWGER